jgi:RNA polymerase I-specific transcription initiation factor RRN7
MDSSQPELQRFPEGITCPVSRCKAKRYYEENGHWYCQNNHELEGVVQDAADEDAFGQQGKVTIKKPAEGGKDKRASQRRLKGPAFRLLFLECFQIVLRRQVQWLMDEKNHPAALEDVTKRLWDLRVRGCPGGDEKDEAVQTLVYGSQAESQSEAEENEGAEQEDWSPNLRDKWPTPSIIDTLGLCYLACVHLGIPTRIADIAHWVNQDDMPFKNIVRIPNDPPRGIRV